jgi:hypothetical protein|tara:strand:- start:28 stop:384 length:357 start_codon:yes stop_codon:yes gene_type:complete
VNAVFVNDPNGHVYEIQLLNQQMMFVRTACGAHHTYNSFRTAIEILEAINEPLPADDDGDIDLSQIARSGGGGGGVNVAEIVSAISVVFDQKLNPILNRLSTMEERLIKIESCVKGEE